MSTDEIRQRIRALDARTRRRNIIGGGAAAIVFCACFWWLRLVPNTIGRIGAALTLIGSAYLLFQIVRNQLGSNARKTSEAGSTASVEFHRAELERQRDFHRGVRFWSRLFLFAPGPLLFMAGLALAAPKTKTIVMVEVLAFIWLSFAAIPRNRKAAAFYQRQIDELDRLRGRES